jgi:hypothetical protein
MPKYIAKQSIGHFMPGDEIKGLEDKQLQALLASGAIEEEKLQNNLKRMVPLPSLPALLQKWRLKANEAILIGGIKPMQKWQSFKRKLKAWKNH